MILNACIEGKGARDEEKQTSWMMNNEPCFVSRDRDGYELRGSGAERHELKHFESQLAGIETLVFLEFSNSISFQSIRRSQVDH